MLNLSKIIKWGARKSACLFFFLLLFSSCADDNLESSSFWSACLIVDKGEGEATLQLIDPRPFSLYVSPGPSDPDYFDIMISDNLKEFSFYKQVDVASSVKIDNLTNGKPYYFFVATHKQGYDPVNSDTVMTIPSAPKTTEPYLPGFDFSIEGLLTSYDLSYLSFTSNSYGGNAGNVLYYKENATGTISALGASLYGANWSETSNKLVYMTDRREGNTTYPYELQLYEPATKKVTTLFNTPYESYYVTLPSFTPDGEKIAFLSSENNSQKYIYDLWTIDPVTKEKTRITNFEDVGFMIGNYDWSHSGVEIYLDGCFQQGNSCSGQGIYKLNLLTKELVPVIVEKWAGFSPSLSPDNTLIAFRSYRNGADELWIYDQVELKFQQITGDIPYSFDLRITNLQWLNDDQLLITASKDQKSMAIKINVN